MNEKVTVLENRLLAFWRAGLDLLNAWQDLEDGEEYGTKGYPFAGSFDDVLCEVNEWASEFINEVKGVQS